MVEFTITAAELWNGGHNKRDYRGRHHQSRNQRPKDIYQQSPETTRGEQRSE